MSNAATAHLILAASAQQEIRPGAPTQQKVLAMVAIQRVATLAADQRVLSAPTGKQVIPAPANEVVMSIAATQDIGAQAAPLGQGWAAQAGPNCL